MSRLLDIHALARLPNASRALLRHRETTADGCWRWTGFVLNGYGEVHLHRNARTCRVHRLAWVIYRGAIPDGLCVLHHCDKPLCFNPDHLFLGTQGDNIADKVAKQRQARGERQGNARLTREQAEEIRALYVRGKVSQRALGEQFGVHLGTIHQVVTEKTWR